MMTTQTIKEQIAELEPWFYEFDLGPHGRTTSLLPPEVAGIHRTRLDMVNSVVERHFGARSSQVRCLDVGCHEGYYSVEMARKGLKEVIGVDFRDSNLRKGRFVADVLGLRNLEFRQVNCEELRAQHVGRFDLVLVLGLLYHLENPMLCLRNVSAVTTELCIVETQVIDEVDGVAEWGARDWTREYQGVLALIDETAEFDTDIRETGATPIAMCPSPRALEVMLRHAGFRRTEIVAPPAGAYEQHARGKRVVCAAYK